MQSSTVDTLFNLFDQNHNGTIELCEVSWGLHKLKPQMPPEDARQQALQHFLLFDQGEQRSASFLYVSSDHNFVHTSHADMTQLSL